MSGPRVVLALALAAALAAAACSGAPPTGVATQPIVNGVVDDADPAVVALVMKTATSTMATCSGEVVSPHVVLTAGHCVAPSTVGPNPPLVVFTGTTLAAATDDQFLAVAELHALPGFGYVADTGADDNDLGVVILAAPTTIAPIPFNRFALPRGPNGAEGRIVGYGLTSGDDYALISAGTRRQAPMRLFSINQDDTLTLYDGSHSICNVDSGGPSLFVLDGSEQIAGVSREIYIGCPVDHGASDTRTDAWADFVDGYIEALDGPTPPGGGSCATNADCAPYVCGDTSAGRMCERPCDPAAAAPACVAGTVCRTLDGKTMCAPPAPRGCAVGGAGGSGGGAAGTLLCVLLALAIRARQRSTSSRIAW